MSHATTRTAEAELLRPVLLGLLRLRWLNQMTLASTEVSWYQKHIDLAFISPRPAIGAVAVELKVDQARRAVEQATLNRLLTPSSWVAVQSAPTASTLSYAYGNGVGVLLVLERAVYPLLFPAISEPRTEVLAIKLEERGDRVRDLLSRIRRG